jgi:hypothetical protein
MGILSLSRPGSTPPARTITDIRVTICYDGLVETRNSATILTIWRRISLEQLRGRNLAHVGLTLGLTLGLAVGLLAALVIVNLIPAQSAVTLGLIAWFGAIIVFGVVGYWFGGYFSRKMWGDTSTDDKD